MSATQTGKRQRCAFLSIAVAITIVPGFQAPRGMQQHGEEQASDARPQSGKGN